jgi:hypothetical protein
MQPLQNTMVPVLRRDTISPATLDGLLGAPSMGKFFNASSKKHGKDGQYDCRTLPVPTY